MTNNLNLSQAFQHYFRVVPVNSDELREEVFRIRYDVYCDELGFLDPAESPNGLEQDAYDPKSLHCLLLHRPTNRFAGCVRLVLGGESEQLPFEIACDNVFHNSDRSPLVLPRSSFGEISRLAVISDFRRRSGERHSASGIVTDPPELDKANQRRFSLIAPGLYLAAAAMGLNHGLDSLFAMMEPRLARHLERYRLRFLAVGDVIDHHGQRGPFHMNKDEFLASVHGEFLELLNAIQAQLAPETDVSDLHTNSSTS